MNPARPISRDTKHVPGPRSAKAIGGSSTAQRRVLAHSNRCRPALIPELRCSLHPPTKPVLLCQRDMASRATQQAAGSFPRPSSGLSNPSTSTSSGNNKARQYAHLHAQLAQLNAHLADTENLVRMTSVQAMDMRFLGGYVGALFMGSAKILGEESVAGRGGATEGQTEEKDGRGSG